MNSSITSKTILVVDDDESVGQVIQVILSRVGYHVIRASNGADALRFAQNMPVIDLLISDLEMPGMRGDELATRFAKLHPAAGIVFVSGFTGPIETTEPFEFLEKPFTYIELRDTVSLALRSRRPPMEKNAALETAASAA